MTQGFDRIRPPGQRHRDDPLGRAALFGDGPARATAGLDPARERGPALVCSRCSARSPLDPLTVVRVAFPLFLVLPWREDPVFALCPACRHRAWLKVVL